MLGAPGRVESLEACCQWALLSVQITRLVTLPYYYNYCTGVHNSLLTVKCTLVLFVFP